MQLPTRPIAFVIAYVLLTAFMVEPTVMGWRGSLYAAWLGFSAVIALHCLWMVQLAGAADRSRQRRLGPVAAERGPDPVSALAWGVPVAVAVVLIAGILLPPPAGAIAGATGAVVALLFLLLIVLTAHRFCREERESGQGSLGVFLTSVLLFYAVIGAFVLASRFKRLEASIQ